MGVNEINLLALPETVRKEKRISWGDVSLMDWLLFEGEEDYILSEDDWNLTHPELVSIYPEFWSFNL